jgi:hypothetical protein
MRKNDERRKIDYEQIKINKFLNDRFQIKKKNKEGKQTRKEQHHRPREIRFKLVKMKKQHMRNKVVIK